MNGRPTYRRVVAIVTLALCVQGCAIYCPRPYWEKSQTDVDLEAKNFKVREVGREGTASCLYVLGFPLYTGVATGIPCGPQDVQAKAWQELHRTCQCQGPSFFHNVVTEWSNTGFPPLFYYHRYTVTADLYEFDKEYVGYAARAQAR